MNRIVRWFKKLYIKPLTEHEKLWLTYVKWGAAYWCDSIKYPPMTAKQYHKMVERDRLYE